jgi:hypothetical protein
LKEHLGTYFFRLVLFPFKSVVVEKKEKKTFKEEIAHLDYCFIKIRHVDLRDKKKEKQTKKAPEEARRWR